MCCYSCYCTFCQSCTVFRLKTCLQILLYIYIQAALQVRHYKWNLMNYHLCCLDKGSLNYHTYNCMLVDYLSQLRRALNHADATWTFWLLQLKNTFVWLSLHQSYSNSSIHASVLNTENHFVSSVAENTRAKSNVFAAENNLPNFQYVLHPRTTGFTFIVDKLRKGDPEQPFQAHCIRNALSMPISQRSIHLFGLLRRSEGVVCVCV